ncbi:receptor-type tyrosine-protein phosphatase H [Melanotaenia boesemani]|uniref:receptor-type tyrosine-protein phosphatase H n=1 Tax=Melanotaenia boesemani TaxID=1250792 RepID=UPI001C03B750|nr:receptor-type tyrosine-protein phosphatase H [Melanotaenia boesemani]
MGKLFQYNVGILICWALVLMDIAAEREYFIPDGNLTWDGARNHCQICFKELVTLTPDNSQLITQRLNSEHWIGLRKNLNSSDNSSMSWAHWANGDPLFFQNWYPGWPVFKSPPPKIDCCSCSCTCPINTPTETMSITPVTENTTDFYLSNESASSLWDSFTSGYTTSGLPLKMESECERSPMPVVLETNKSESYIEDSCVAMLSFGPWVEKSCLELLPYICFEDRFLGQVNVTNVTLTTATLAWLPGPGDITYYRVEIQGDVERKYNLSSLIHDVVNLTSGGFYKVQVFPVKCKRDLNPQNSTFYTVPNKVTDLNVIHVTNTSVTLSWNKPEGKMNFYLVKYDGKEIKLETQLDVNTTINGLIPGGLYTFTVQTRVQDESRRSEESNITTNTKPGKVSSLKVSLYTNRSALLTWTAPEGNFTGFRVKVTNANLNRTNNSEVGQDKRDVLEENLPDGSKICFSVRTLVNYTSSSSLNYTVLASEGDEETTVIYTAPGPISNLLLSTDEKSLTASWSPPNSNYSSFIVELKLDNVPTDTTNTNETTNTTVTFSELKNSASYTVKVSASFENVRGPSVKNSTYTLPSPPTNPIAITITSNSITFGWNAPVNSATPLYHVKLNSTIWNYNTSYDINSSTNYTFTNLTSGTKYQFSVSVLAGGMESNPATCSVKTVANKVNITLAMLCSSVQPLLCGDETSMTKVLAKLKEYFTTRLGDSIEWTPPQWKNPGT